MRNKLIYAMSAVAAVLLVRNLYAIFMDLPDEVQQGMIFRIIFFHVPSWVVALGCAAAGFLASIGFLITKNFKFDAIAVAVTEVGLAFTTVGLVTGSIWGRIMWGVWWAWDARLTSALICWLLYGGYLMLRHAIDEPSQRATFAAAVNIFAFVDVPIVIFSIKWWNTQHPRPVFWAGGSFDPVYLPTFLLNMLAMVLIGIVMVLVRLRQEETQREIDSLRRYAHAI